MKNIGLIVALVYYRPLCLEGFCCKCNFPLLLLVNNCFIVDP